MRVRRRRRLGALVPAVGIVAAAAIAGALLAARGDQRLDRDTREPLGGPRTTERVSVRADGVQANGRSDSAAISADGRYVAFSSYAWNLAPGDGNRRRDILIHDRRTGRVERASVGSDGGGAAGPSYGPQLSADARYVVFRSDAPNLVPGDRNGRMDIFVRDRALGRTERISVDRDGGDANDDSPGAYISGNGRLVAFTSVASDLVAGDANGVRDAFVRDRVRGTTRRLSLAPGGREARMGSHVAAISRNGRFVAFRSSARTFVPGDGNELADLFVADLATGSVDRVNVGTGGIEASGRTFRGSLSADGRYVAFRSFASNLVPHDANGTPDVFVHDRRTGVTERVSVTSEGAQVTGSPGRPFVSGDGRYVVFRWEGAGLVAGDTNGVADVFVHDRATGSTIRVSVGSAGDQATGPALRPAISADGRFVAFSSLASNLVAGDTNDVADVFVHRVR